MEADRDRPGVERLPVSRVAPVRGIYLDDDPLGSAVQTFPRRQADALDARVFEDEETPLFWLTGLAMRALHRYTDPSFVSDAEARAMTDGIMVRARAARDDPGVVGSLKVEPRHADRHLKVVE